MWILSTVDEGRKARFLLHAVERLAPFSYRDESWLRRKLADVPNEEIDTFLAVIEGYQHGRKLLSEWNELLNSCRYKPPHEDCKVHLMIRCSEAWYHLIDWEWHKLAPWYPRKAFVRYEGGFGLNGLQAELQIAEAELEAAATED
jgi:hypothetical protein